MKIKNPKTTAAAVFTAIAALLTAGAAILDGDPETAVNIPAISAAVVGAAGAFGLFSASDGGA